MAMTLAEIRRSKAEWQANYKVAHPDRVRISNCSELAFKISW